MQCCFVFDECPGWKARVAASNTVRCRPALGPAALRHLSIIAAHSCLLLSSRTGEGRIIDPAAGQVRLQSGRLPRGPGSAAGRGVDGSGGSSGGTAAGQAAWSAGELLAICIPLRCICAATSSLRPGIRPARHCSVCPGPLPASARHSRDPEHQRRWSAPSIASPSTTALPPPLPLPPRRPWCRRCSGVQPSDLA